MVELEDIFEAKGLKDDYVKGPVFAAALRNYKSIREAFSSNADIALARRKLELTSVGMALSVFCDEAITNEADMTRSQMVELIMMGMTSVWAIGYTDGRHDAAKIFVDKQEEGNS